MIRVEPIEGKLNDRYQLILSKPKTSFKEAKTSFLQNPFILFLESQEKDNEFIFTFEPMISGPIVLSVNGEAIKFKVDSIKAATLKPMKPLSYEAVIPFELSQENEILLNEITLSQPKLNVDLVSSKTFPILPILGLLLIGTLLPLLLFYLKGKKEKLPPKEEALETLK
ncbi:MAG: hypothetical protein ACK4HV_05755, partial [Parachlamydiaceae bacterium]